MSDEILQPNQPAEFQAWAPYPKFRKLKSGEVFTITLTVEERVWELLRTIPENNICEIVLWHHDGTGVPVSSVLAKTTIDEAHKDSLERQSARPAQESKGVYSAFWRVMCANGVKHHPDLPEALDCTSEQVWDALHAQFGVKTMATVSPRAWESWVEANGLSDGLITMSRSAERQAIASNQ